MYENSEEFSVQLGYDDIDPTIIPKNCVWTYPVFWRHMYHKLILETCFESLFKFVSVQVASIKVLQSGEVLIRIVMSSTDKELSEKHVKKIILDNKDDVMQVCKRGTLCLYTWVLCVYFFCVLSYFCVCDKKEVCDSFQERRIWDVCKF